MSTPALPFAHLKLTSQRPDRSTPEPRSIAGRIRWHRQKLGLTQRELAKELGVSVDTVRNWELGRSHPGLRQAPKISEIMNRFMVPLAGDFSTRLQLARCRLGLSQAEFGARIGVSKDTVWGWENGRHHPGDAVHQKANELVEQALTEDERGAMRVRWLRKRLGLTQRELAAQLDVHSNTVSRWERGRWKPPEEVLEWIEELF